MPGLADQARHRRCPRTFVHPHRLRRLIVLFLLTWIAADLAAIHTCALDVDAEVAGDPGGTAAFSAPGPSHLPAALHPDHCFCHGHTLAPDDSAGLAAPVLDASSVADATAASPRDAASALYHPPQLSPSRRG